MNPQHLRGVRFNTALWRGYARTGVDELLERAAIQLEARQSPVDLIRRTDLGTARWGYQASEVDAFLGQLQRRELDPDGPGTEVGPPVAVQVRKVLLRAAVVIGIGGVVGAIAGPAVTATLLVVILVLVQPFAGQRRYRRLAQQVLRDGNARLRHYLSGMSAMWSYVAVVAVIGLLSSRHPSSIGLTLHATDRNAAAQSQQWITTTFVALAVSTVLIWRAGPKLTDRIRRQLLRFGALLPHTRVERVAFVGVSITAGVCEEILYRGFGISYLRWLSPGLGHAGLIWVTAAAFGFAHLYQGPRNVLLTGLAGAGFAWVTLATGTLLPAMIIHALVDLRVCFLPGKLLHPSRTAQQPTPAPSSFATEKVR